MKKRLQIILPLLVLVIATIFGYKTLKTQIDNSAIRFSGNIEVTEAQMSFKIPGRLAGRLVEEGDMVNAGQSLARLEETDQTIEVARAEANLAYADAVLAELEAGSRKEEIERAEAKLMQARHSLTELQQGSRTEEIKSASAERDSAMAAQQSAVVKLRQANSD